MHIPNTSTFIPCTLSGWSGEGSWAREGGVDTGEGCVTTGGGGWDVPIIVSDLRCLCDLRWSTGDLFVVAAPGEVFEVLLEEERIGKERVGVEVVFVRGILVLLLSFFGGSWISFFTHERILSLSSLDKIFKS